MQGPEKKLSMKRFEELTAPRLLRGRSVVRHPNWELVQEKMVLVFADRPLRLWQMGVTDGVLVHLPQCQSVKITDIARLKWGF